MHPEYRRRWTAQGRLYSLTAHSEAPGREVHQQMTLEDVLAQARWLLEQGAEVAISPEVRIEWPGGPQEREAP